MWFAGKIPTSRVVNLYLEPIIPLQEVPLEEVFLEVVKGNELVVYQEHDPYDVHQQGSDTVDGGNWAEKHGPAAGDGPPDVKLYGFAEKVKQESVYCYSEYSGNSTYQVRAHGDEQFVVDINDKTCGCNKWQLIGISCVHGMAALLSTNHNLIDFIHLRYKKESFLRCPDFRKQRGIPKNMRTLQSDEVRIGNTTKLRRNYVVVRCRKCGKEGHNRVTYERRGGGTDSVRGSVADEGESESVGGSQAELQDGRPKGGKRRKTKK
ncbi:hypothetical protein Ddye_030597 [Dipteronia dyeriana]|uniref:SWIM-type domain-containing protein n=1 Tax=Dipteronia dyeriana TaxID=168575 RepID=A0AAD9WMV9_9ROSI|nr:hypothetical protein Ddye_030597 [Dipteronia dyeriana]